MGGIPPSPGTDRRRGISSWGVGRSGPPHGPTARVPRASGAISLIAEQQEGGRSGRSGVWPKERGMLARHVRIARHVPKAAKNERGG